LHLKAEGLKRNLEGAYDFNPINAFKAVDDSYIDEKNLRRFLRNVSYLASKQELVAIIRRFDTDGDAKINRDEFIEGIKS
jgi:Ca2+-binding EF-hand superfamily protein